MEKIAQQICRKTALSFVTPQNLHVFEEECPTDLEPLCSGAAHFPLKLPCGLLHLKTSMRPIAFKNPSKSLKAGISGTSFFWHSKAVFLIALIYIGDSEAVEELP